MAAKSKVLIVEDEKDIAELMTLHLRREGLEVDIVDNGEDATRLLNSKKFSVIILDWMLPGVSGLELCKKWRADGRENGAVPILMVTARAQTADIVLGLEMGADDYLTKPFDISELLARVRSLLRRGTWNEDEGTMIEVGKLKMDAERHQVVCEDEEVELTPSEFKLLHALMKNKGRVLTRERLIELVQGEGVTVIDRAIDTHIFGLRKKLGSCSEIVETVRGVGYRVSSHLA